MFIRAARNAGGSPPSTPMNTENPSPRNVMFQVRVNFKASSE